jgi:mono/diheme cytochrome c family protein
VLKDIILSSSDSIQFGKKKFSALCAYCHGNAGSGGKARKLQGRKLEVDYVFNTITNGKKRGSLNMPPWRKLPEVVRWQLVAYILSLGEINK